MNDTKNLFCMFSATSTQNNLQVFIDIFLFFTDI